MLHYSIHFLWKQNKHWNRCKKNPSLKYLVHKIFQILIHIIVICDFPKSDDNIKNDVILKTCLLFSHGVPVRQQQLQTLNRERPSTALGQCCWKLLETLLWLQYVTKSICFVRVLIVHHMEKTSNLPKIDESVMHESNHSLDWSAAENELISWKSKEEYVAIIQKSKQICI